MSAHETSVLIVGGGPVGLALAIELGMNGVPCTLIERRDGKLTVPKSSLLSVRNMEFNRRWGIARRVAGAGWPLTHPNDLVYCTSLRGPELGRAKGVPYAELKLPHTPEPACGCAQIFYDPILLARARSLPSVTIRFHCGLESLSQDASGVLAEVVDSSTGARETLRARYLVGCDGAGSVVAKEIGAVYEGPGVLSTSCNIFFRSSALASLHDKGWARIYRFTDEGGSWGEVIAVDGKELWRLSVFRKDHNYDAARYLTRLAGGEFPYELLNVADWGRRDSVASKYREGRVFIAGDAAHQNSPTGGLGLHCGVGDVVDLGWKLVAVLRGWGGPDLLPSYEVERKPVGVANVRESTAMFELLTGLPGAPGIHQLSPGGEEARLAWAAAFRTARNGRTPAFTENLRLGYCYDGSPIVISDGTASPPVETPEFIPTTRPGTRAPHAWLDTERSTLDLFGGAFVLLRLGARPPPVEALVNAAARVSMPLRVEDVDDDGIAALYERRLVLVRPDGHVAWRGDELAPNATRLIDTIRGALQS
jgi:2-polyprenyl-6-methoxyphenol hydroxylase-like FAD-dependent oxidoreductase